MSFILDGTINGMRAVSGEVTHGKHAGSFWHFLSMEVCDSRFGQVYSCQVRTSEKDLFGKFIKIGLGKDKDGKEVEMGSLIQDLTGHDVRLLIKGVSGGIRTLPGNGNEAQGEEIIQVRFYVAGVKDLGLPTTDDF